MLCPACRHQHTLPQELTPRLTKRNRKADVRTVADTSDDHSIGKRCTSPTTTWSVSGALAVATQCATASVGREARFLPLGSRATKRPASRHMPRACRMPHLMRSAPCLCYLDTAARRTHKAPCACAALHHLPQCRMDPCRSVVGGVVDVLRQALPTGGRGREMFVLLHACQARTSLNRRLEHGSGAEHDGLFGDRDDGVVRRRLVDIDRRQTVDLRDLLEHLRARRDRSVCACVY